MVEVACPLCAGLDSVIKVARLRDGPEGIDVPARGIGPRLFDEDVVKVESVARRMRVQGGGGTAGHLAHLEHQLVERRTVEAEPAALRVPVARSSLC